MFSHNFRIFAASNNSNMFTRRKRWRVPAGEEPTALDRKVMAFENRGALVPKRTLIRTPEEIEGIRRSGVINTAILDLVGEKIHAGMNTLEINDIVHNYTIEHNAIPATLGYEGFPKSVCTSINEVVCHGIPSAKEILKEGDIINVDCTTILDGYYADASRMFIIGKTTPQKKNWCKWPRNVSKSAWKPPSLSALSATSAMPLKNMHIRTALAWCATYAAMAWD